MYNTIKLKCKYNKTYKYAKIYYNDWQLRKIVIHVNIFLKVLHVAKSSQSGEWLGSR